MLISPSDCLVFVKMNNRGACSRPEPKAAFGDRESFGAAMGPAASKPAAGRVLAGVARAVSLHPGVLRGLKSTLASRGGTP